MKRANFERKGTPVATQSPTVKDLHWAAGLLEGEGHFRKSRTSEVVTASMTDFEPVEKLQKLFGGSVKYLDLKREWKPIARWTVCGARARGVMMTLFPLLSPRRKEQIEQALAS